MAIEAAAIVGLVASIVALVEVSTKIIGRLNEFGKTANRYPKTFGAIQTDLPLLIRTLKQVEKDIWSGHVTPDTEKDLSDVVGGCLGRVRALEKILDKALPKKSDCKWDTVVKAVASVFKEGKVTGISTEIRNSVQTLVFYQMTGVVGRPDVYTLSVAVYFRLMTFAKNVGFAIQASPEFILQMLLPLVVASLIGMLVFSIIVMSPLVVVLCNQASITGYLCRFLSTSNGWTFMLFRYILKGWKAQYCPAIEKNSHWFW